MKGDAWGGRIGIKIIQTLNGTRAASKGNGSRVRSELRASGLALSNYRGNFDVIKLAEAQITQGSAKPEKLKWKTGAY